MNRVGAWILGGILVLLSLSLEAAQEDKSDVESKQKHSNRISLLALSGLKGKLASPDCRSSEPINSDRLHYGKLVSAYNSILEKDSESDSVIPVFLGNAVYPGAIGRYLFSKGTEGIERFADLFRAVPYSGYVPGTGDVETPVGELSAFAEKLESNGTNYGASNIQCKEKTNAGRFCRTLQNESWVVTRNGTRIGMVPLIDPRIEQLVPRSKRDSFEITEPEEALVEAGQRLRETKNADLVVGLYQLTEQSNLDEAVRLASRVESADLVVTNRRFSVEATGSSTHNGYVVAPGTGTYVVGLKGGNGDPSLVEFEISIGKENRIADFSAETIELDHYESSGSVLASYQKLGRDFCRDRGKPIHEKGQLKGTWNLDEFRSFVLNTMRFSSESELSVVHRKFFANPDHFPISKQMTLADIYTVLPSERRLVTTLISGEVIKKIAAQKPVQLIWGGLSTDGDSILVNGRSINPNRTYRVATTGFLAEEGYSIFEQKQLQDIESFRGKQDTASSLIIDFIRNKTFAAWGDAVDYLDPERNFPDLSRQFLWRYSGSLNGSYNKVTVSNPTQNGNAAYSQSQLNVQSTDQIDVEAELSADAVSKNHGWSNNATLQYATAQLDGSDGGFEETKDLIRVKSQYKYSGFRARAGNQWWVPMPATELQGESEFDKPSERDWHKIELTGILGLRFRLFEPFELKAGFNARRDVNQPGGATVVGLNAGYTLERTSLEPVLGKPMMFKSELEYFYNDIQQQNIQELRNTNRLYYALLGQLHFTTTFNAFAYRSDSVGDFGTNTELLIGLNYLWDSEVQSF